MSPQRHRHRRPALLTAAAALTGATVVLGATLAPASAWTAGEPRGQRTVAVSGATHATAAGSTTRLAQLRAAKVRPTKPTKTSTSSPSPTATTSPSPSPTATSSPSPTATTSPASTSSPSPSATVAEVEAQVWVTTNDGSRRLALTGTSGATPPAVGEPVISVDTGSTGQSVVGFGAALTHSSAELLAGLPAQRREDLLRELFAPDGPVRLSVVRVPLGSSDFVSVGHSTYDDTVGNEPDWALEHFSTSQDEAALRPVLREIRAINPDVVVIASPWSAPAWLKTTKHLYAGSLDTSDPRTLPTYARYLARALTDYRDAGVPVDVLTLQNEPQTRGWGDYPRMEMPVAHQVALLQELQPQLTGAGLTTKVLAFDHNWAQHPADVEAAPTGTDPEHDYAARVLGSPAGEVFAGVAYHCYYGDATAQEELLRQVPGTTVWVTECSGSHTAGDAPEKYFADTLYWQSKNLMVASLRHSASAVVTWNLALDAEGGPHVGGCSTCQGVVTIQDGTVTPNGEYYALAHAAGFIARDSVRVTSSSSAETLDAVAFRNPDGTVAILVHHTGWHEQSFSVMVDGVSYAAAVPAWSTATIHVGPRDQLRP